MSKNSNNEEIKENSNNEEIKKLELSIEEIEATTSDFFRLVCGSYHALSGGKSIIPSGRGAILKGEIKEQCREFLNSCKEGDKDFIETKVHIASLELAEFISTQETRPFQYTKDIIGTTKGLLTELRTMSITNLLFPGLGMAWHFFYRKHLETIPHSEILRHENLLDEGGLGSQSVPDYRDDNKEAFNQKFKEIFSNVKSMNNEREELSSNLTKLIDNFVSKSRSALEGSGKKLSQNHTFTKESFEKERIERIEELQTKGENSMHQPPHNKPSASSSAPLSQEQGREK